MKFIDLFINKLLKYFLLTIRQAQGMIQDKHKTVGNFSYNPEDILGSGAWGTVYKAKHKDETIKKSYALKKINKYKIEASEATLEKFQSQVKTLQKAHYIPQIIYFVDFFKTKSSYYIVTEFEEGCVDLYDFMCINPQKFSQSEARPIMMELLKGIQALHQMKVVHRDLKLQNILYNPHKGKVKVIDFGIATTFDCIEGRVGSPLFMSPQVLKEQSYTHKCDIWSLGIVFYWMVCHISPYGENPSINHIMDVMTDLDTSEKLPVPKTVYLSERCEEVIRACLRWQQNERVNIDQILKMKFFTQPDLSRFKQCLQAYEPQFSFMN